MRSILALAVFLTVQSVVAQESYPDHPDSLKKDGVPEGRVDGPFEWRSDIFPGTTRNYWVYVPAQYDEHVKNGKKPCVCVVQDGLGKAKSLKLPTVFDNLTAERAMPVTVGIFIDHGKVEPIRGEGQIRFNRSFEYDSMGDRYARFLIEEILPEVSKSYELSSDPNDRMILGSSSGAVCAWTVAWERPDEFRRVFSSVGTFVGLRGANEYPTLVRKVEPKPIRMYIQDGSNDLDIYAGSWWNANLSMLSALQYAGYDVKHVWGEGGHNGKQATAIFPDAVRWLWRDYPEPIKAGHSDKRRMNILIEGEDWELVSGDHQFTDAPALGPDGNFYFSDLPASKILKVNHAGEVSPFSTENGGVAGMMWAPNGKLYCTDARAKKILEVDAEGHAKTLVDDTTCNDLVCVDHGLYYTDPRTKTVWYVKYDGKRQPATKMIESSNGIITSADQNFLWVADSGGRFLYNFRIEEDGSLTAGQEYGYVHRDPHEGRSKADGMTVDTKGNVYLGSPMGVQVFDQLGRVNIILRSPNGKMITNVVFAGPNRDELFATCGDAVYKRKLNAVGVVPWEKPVDPPKPGL